MGTNYYMMNKKDYDIEIKIDKLLGKDSYENENKRFIELAEKVKELILKEYKSGLDILKEEKLDNILENYDEALEVTINDFISNLRYRVDDAFNLREIKSKHIGKSSAGWLFNFQEQEEWHSYKEFKNYILNEENMKDKVIFDEYREVLTPKKMLDIIDTKQKNKQNLENPDNFKYCRNVDGYRFSSGDFS